eukprot:5401036-Heterocapsa_arctica.AAC.1
MPRALALSLCLWARSSRDEANRYAQTDPMMGTYLPPRPDGALGRAARATMSLAAPCPLLR